MSEWSSKIVNVHRMAVIAAGYNASLQLGSGHTGSPPTKLPIDTDELIWLTSGEDHTVFIFRDGTASALGDDEDYAIGTTNRMVYGSPTIIDLDSTKFRFAHSNQYYSSYVSNTGQLTICSMCRPNHPTVFKCSSPIIYVAGTPKCPVAIDETGAAHFFSEDSDRPPVKVSLAKPIYDISVTHCLALAITTDGTAYGSGILNNGDAALAPIPSLRAVQCRISFASDGHAGVVTRDGKVFVCGEGESGELGLGEAVKEVGEFQLISGLADHCIVQATTGLSHSLFLADTGKVYGCGTSRDGQLFMGTDADNCFVPVELPIAETVAWITSGQLQSFALVGRSAFVHPGMRHFGIP
jgi:alpha-tubulin suppressor-like RCC1 family protein